MKKNLYLYCGKPGHRAKECPAKGQQVHTLKGEPSDKKDDWGPASKADSSWITEEDKKQEKWWKETVIIKEKEEGTLRRITSETPEKRETSHAWISWTACYDDGCLIHQGEKDGSGWYPKKPRKAKQQSLSALTGAPEHDSDSWETDMSELRLPENDQYLPKTEITDFKELTLEVKTNQWRRILCENSDCLNDAQHSHRIYSSETRFKEKIITLQLRKCEKKDCSDRARSQIHAHQGSAQRGLPEGITWQETEEEDWQETWSERPDVFNTPDVITELRTNEESYKKLSCFKT
jgi:Zinc knuckle